jgi:hypothetical protein
MTLKTGFMKYQIIIEKLLGVLDKHTEYCHDTMLEHPCCVCYTN